MSSNRLDKDAKSNNLQLIRFFAAAIIIVTHAHPLAGRGTLDIIAKMSGSSMYIGPPMMYSFFIISGFLTAKSLLRKKAEVKAWPFIKARLIRLIPPLAFVVFACAILGVFVTTLSAKEYFTNTQTYKYLLNGVFILVHDLPGVFTGNVNMRTVNGGLWSMPVEFLCYILALVLYKLGWMKKKSILIVSPFVFAAAYFVIQFLPYELVTGIRSGLMFYLGILFYIFWDYVKFSTWLDVFAVAFIFATFALRVPYLGLYLFMPYVILSMSFGKRQVSDKLGKLGNYAFCEYLWGFPVQQTLVHLNGGSMNPYVNYALSIPIATVLAVGTYYLIEKPVMDRLIAHKKG